MFSLSTGFQGLTESQSELVEHWYSRRQGATLPTRESLDPGAMRAHLSAISIVELESDGAVRFRLAGSGLRTILGREMRGRLVSDLDQNVSEMWSLGLSAAIEQARPVGGIIERGEDCHVWLRLPLRSAQSRALVLCHDTLVPRVRLNAKNSIESRSVMTRRSTLAA